MADTHYNLDTMGSFSHNRKISVALLLISVLAMSVFATYWLSTLPKPLLQGESPELEPTPLGELPESLPPSARALNNPVNLLLIAVKSTTHFEKLVRTTDTNSPTLSKPQKEKIEIKVSNISKNPLELAPVDP